MNNSTFTSIIASLYLLLSIVIISCNTKNTETKSTDTGSTGTVASATAISSLDLNLYPLYTSTTAVVSAINSATAVGKKQKVLLQFVIVNNGTSNYLSLNGWFPNKPSSGTSTVENFDAQPNIQLTKIPSTTVVSDICPIDSGTYFGNLFIDRPTLKNLYKQAASSTAAKSYVIFFPSIQNSHVQYLISLSPTAINPTRQVIVGAGASDYANPTPPRQYETN